MRHCRIYVTEWQDAFKQTQTSLHRAYFSNTRARAHAHTQTHAPRVLLFVLSGLSVSEVSVNWKETLALWSIAYTSLTHTRTRTSLQWQWCVFVQPASEHVCANPYKGVCTEEHRGVCVCWCVYGNVWMCVCVWVCASNGRFSVYVAASGLTKNIQYCCSPQRPVCQLYSKNCVCACVCARVGVPSGRGSTFCFIFFPLCHRLYSI